MFVKRNVTIDSIFFFFSNVHGRNCVKYMDNSPLLPKSFPNVVFSSLMGDFYRCPLGFDYLCVHSTLKGWNGCFSSEMKVTAAADAQGRKNPFRAESLLPSERQEDRTSSPLQNSHWFRARQSSQAVKNHFLHRIRLWKQNQNLFFNLSWLLL